MTIAAPTLHGMSVRAIEEKRQLKRPRDVAVSDDHKPQPESKRRRTSSHIWPPHVWDTLSRIAFTRKALAEFNRRTDKRKSTAGIQITTRKRRLLRLDIRRLEQIAGEGGLNMGRARGYSDRRGRTVAKPNGLLGEPPAETPGQKKISTTGPYDRNFDILMMQNGVYPDVWAGTNGISPDPNNLEDILRRLEQSRRSSSPSGFDQEDFKRFQKDSAMVCTEQDVMMDIMPLILGRRDRQQRVAADLEFSNMEKFHPTLTIPKPDRCYGLLPWQIDNQIREDLDNLIVPSIGTMYTPMAPNMFLEVKGPGGRLNVLRRQAMYAGAVGARAMHQLQNYGKETPIYDGNAYCTTATYNSDASTLDIYATHARPSPCGQPQYFLTPLTTHCLKTSLEEFRRGATAYRNARDMTQEMRDRFAAEANATLLNLRAIAISSAGNVEEVTTVPATVHDTADAFVSAAAHDSLEPDVPATAQDTEGPSASAETLARHDGKPLGRKRARISVTPDSARGPGVKTRELRTKRKSGRPSRVMTRANKSRAVKT